MVDTSYMLLTVLQAYAPDADSVEKCSAWYNRMKGEGCSSVKLDRVLSATIHDGLAYGNWMWGAS